MFASMVRDYLDAHPSGDFSVRTVGRDLPDFLASFEEIEPYYSELARFEWAFTDALYAKDEEVLTLEVLAQIPPEYWSTLTLTLHPSVQLLSCRYNTLELWESIKEGNGDLEIETHPEPVTHLIWRRDNEAFYCPLTKEQGYLIHVIARGENFDSLCHSMLDYFSEDETAQWVVDTLQKWVVDGFFASL